MPEDVVFNNKKDSIQQMVTNGSRPVLEVDTNRLENINESHHLDEQTPYIPQVAVHTINPN